MASFYSFLGTGVDVPRRTRARGSPFRCPAGQGTLRCFHEPRPIHTVLHCDLAFRGSISRSFESIQGINSKSELFTRYSRTLATKCLTRRRRLDLTHPLWDPKILPSSAVGSCLGTPQLARWKATQPSKWPRLSFCGYPWFAESSSWCGDD